MATKSKRMTPRTDERMAIGYVRVSTTGQAEEGVSLDAQREAIKAHCQLQGLCLVGIEADEGVSGSRMANRPGLRKAIESVSKAGGVLVTYSLSRLARNTKETLETAERLEAAGADLASLSERIDTTGACGRMVFRMMAVLAEFERDQIAERTRAALAHKKAKGEKTGGSVPFGYTAEDRNGKAVLVPVAAEQEVIRDAAAMQEKGMSLRAIGAELEARGIMTKTGRGWNPKTVRSMLSRAA